MLPSWTTPLWALSTTAHAAGLAVGDDALYPHLSTFDNIAYPLREQRFGRRPSEIAA